MNIPTGIIYVVILIMSVVIHELAHGYAARWLGDKTAQYEGRLTLNPMKHLDPLGSVVLPLVLVFTGSPFVLGWAKPVPFNPYNFTKHRKWGSAIVAMAGPLSNLAIAGIFALGMRFGASTATGLSMAMMTIMSMVVLTNLVLMLFNLIPIPPLDGHHIAQTMFPKTAAKLYSRARGWGIFLYFIAFMLVWQILQPLVFWIYRLLVGAPM